VTSSSAPPQKRVSRDWWLIALTALSLVFSAIALYVSLSYDKDRDRETAALRVCEIYASGPAMRALADDIFKRSTRFDVQTNRVITRDYSSAEQADVNIDGMVLKHELLAWLNFLDVIASGLDEDRYDRHLIYSCFQDFFEHAAAKLVGPNGRIFPKQDFDRIIYWSEKLKNYKNPH
jgi:hypothetical protein